MVYPLVKGGRLGEAERGDFQQASEFVCLYRALL